MSKRKKLSYERFRSLCIRAIQLGAQPRANGSLHWGISGGCEAPYSFEVQATNQDQSQHRYIDLDTRCRKCPVCLRARAAFWRLRMETELNLAVRSWLVTLTLTPERQSWAEMSAQHRLRKREVLWTEIDEARRFRERCLAISPEITRYLKRVRERAQGPVRLCLVAERHKSGLPHFHALIHETTSNPVRYKDITEPWLWGFSSAKLVKADHAKAAAYVAKYLTKSAETRVRASRGYGDPATIVAQHALGQSAQARGHNVVDSPPSGESVHAWLDFIASLRHNAESSTEETN